MPEGGFVIVWQLGASSLFPWQVCEVFADTRGGSFYDYTVLWRVRKGVRGCQRGSLFAVARQLGAGSLFSIVRQSGASSSSPGGAVKVFTDARRGLFIIVWQLGASSVFV
jgi:hypothetical protein